jgi:hypothetical protein
MSLPLSQRVAIAPACPTLIHSTPHSIYVRSILILLSHLGIGFPSDFSRQVFKQTNAWFLFSPMRLTCITYRGPSWFQYPAEAILGQNYNCELLHMQVPPSSFFFLSLKSKYSPKQPLLTYLSECSHKIEFKSTY